MNVSIASIGWIAAGGACGAIARYVMAAAVARALPGNMLPWGTLAVNVAGCLAIGLLVPVAERALLSADARTFLVVGLLGAFTTFSTFSLETVNLLLRRQYIDATGNILLNVTLCIAAVLAGIVGARLLWPPVR